MLQQPGPDDYAVATGETHSVREFCERAFAVAGLDYREYVTVDPHIGDAAKAKEVLGWRPRHTFDNLVRGMVEANLEKVPQQAGCVHADGG